MKTSPAQRKTVTVAQLNRQVKMALEANYAGIWVEGEITSATVARSGHVYLTLSDPGNRAQIDGVMWRGIAARYGRLMREGTSVLCRGKVTLYEAGGRYQFVIDMVEDSGEGAKARALVELKAKLQAEGVFAPERKRGLPWYPATIGVVTSRSGAAIRDIIKVLSRRSPVQLLLAHAAVQGEQAAGEITDAVRWLSHRPEIDVLIVGRGGGSSEDLDAFNDEYVVRAVAESPVPVICAVGHEVDVSLAELAADMRAATPSEAAELAIPEADMVRRQLRDLKHRLWTAMGTTVSRKKERAFLVNHRLTGRDPRVRLRQNASRLSTYKEYLSKWPARLSDEEVKVAALHRRLEIWASKAVFDGRTELASASRGLYMWPDPAMESARGRLGRLAASLDALSPLASLGRGYAIVQKGDAILRNVSDVEVGDEIGVRLASGEMTAEVKTKKL